MATISTIWAQSLPFQTSYTFQTVDQDGTNTRTFASGANTTSPKWYRFLCALVAGGATADNDCQELTSAFESLLNTSGSRYTVTVSETGYVQVTYNGTGTSTLTWGSSGSNALRAVLGFSAGWTSLASGATTTASNQPSHVVYSFSMGGDSGWTAESGHQAISEVADGKVYRLTDQVHRSTRSFDLRLHPRTDSVRSSLGSTPITPAFPTLTRTLTPSASLIAGAPWSVWELIQTTVSDGGYGSSGRIGLCVSDFQNLRNGVAVTVDEVYFRANTVMRAAKDLPSVPNWSKLVDCKGIEVTRLAQLTVTV